MLLHQHESSGFFDSIVKLMKNKITMSLSLVGFAWDNSQQA